ncbi:sensor histidine kinase [Peijinzhouia sedimentorum]
MKRKLIYLINGFYWLIFTSIIIIILLASGVGEESSISFNKFRLITVPIIIIPSIISFYIAYQFLFPKYIKTRSIPVLSIYTSMVAIGGAILGLIIISSLLGNQFTLHNGLDLFIGKFILTLSISLLNIGSGFIIKGFINWYSDLKIKEELQQKAQVMELSLIESKLDPHFLFNTINNIDVLVKSDSKKASEYLNKLSSILRFILYESKGRKIKLFEEIDYIMRYIELQKIRTSNQNFISVDIKQEHIDSLIYPMTFIPFIENAFKHCTNKKIEKAIEVSILSTKKQIHFKCRNKFSISSKPVNGGMGNELIENRLRLLYPDGHILETFKNGDQYTIDLKIEL